MILLKKKKEKPKIHKLRNIYLLLRWIPLLGSKRARFWKALRLEQEIQLPQRKICRMQRLYKVLYYIYLGVHKKFGIRDSIRVQFEKVRKKFDSKVIRFEINSNQFDSKLIQFRIRTRPNSIRVVRESGPVRFILNWREDFRNKLAQLDLYWIGPVWFCVVQFDSKTKAAARLRSKK